MRSHICSCT